LQPKVDDLLELPAETLRVRAGLLRDDQHDRVGAGDQLRGDHLPLVVRRAHEHEPGRREEHVRVHDRVRQQIAGAAGGAPDDLLHRRVGAPPEELARSDAAFDDPVHVPDDRHSVPAERPQDEAEFGVRIDQLEQRVLIAAHRRRALVLVARSQQGGGQPADHEHRHHDPDPRHPAHAEAHERDEHEDLDGEGDRPADPEEAA
jgi:hypothetical protein